MITFSPRKFPDRATFYPQGAGPDARGGSRVTPAPRGVTLPAYVEPEDERADRGEAHRAPEARKKWNVFTPSDPAAAVDSTVQVAGRTMTLVVVKSERQHAAALLWRTECLEVT